MININNNFEVKKELMKLASTNILLSTPVALLSTLITVLAFWNTVDKIILLIWFGIITIFLFVRNIRARLYLNNKSNLLIDKEEKLFKILSLLTSVVISIGVALFLSDSQPLHQAFLVMIMASFSAASIISLSVYKNLARNYLLILLVPFIYSVYSLGSDLHTLMALLISLYLILFIIFSKKYHSSIIEVIKSKLIIQEAKKELELSQNHFHTIFKQTPIGIFTYDENLIIKDLNIAFASILKTPLEELVKLDMKLLPDQSIRQALDITLESENGFYEGEYSTKTSNEDIWISMQTVPILDADDNVKGGIAIVADITQRIRSEEKIRHQAFYDHLTGLVNRLAFNEALDQELARLSSHEHYGAVLFIDIDHFKTINDSLGHHIGDILLKTFSSRAFESIRKEDTIARLGGDEFVILLSDLGNDEMRATEFAQSVACNLHSLMKTPIEVEENTLHITISVGITLINAQETNINNILKHADIAMYEAKLAGRNTTRFFEKEMSLKIQEQLILNNEIREAIINDQFELYYQPIVETKNSNIISCEALIRWKHPTKGLIFPDAFIPYAEESDLIITIGEWVINRACVDHLQYKDKLQNISINISSKHFAKSDFATNILATLKKYNINPNIFKLELTESVAVDNISDTSQKMILLQSHGFLIAMDDFGTGYSSLSYLKNLPFDFLKIDRSFIENILINEDDASLVKTILTISKQFKFAVIAEGVETKSHVEFLKALDCEYYQGYVMSKPIPLSKLKELCDSMNFHNL